MCFPASLTVWCHLDLVSALSYLHDVIPFPFLLSPFFSRLVLSCRVLLCLAPAHALPRPPLLSLANPPASRLRLASGSLSPGSRHAQIICGTLIYGDARPDFTFPSHLGSLSRSLPPPPCLPAIRAQICRDAGSLAQSNASKSLA